MSGQDCDGAKGQAPIRSLLAKPLTPFVGPLGIDSTNQNEGKLASQNSGQNRPEKPRHHHRSQNSGHEGRYDRANLAGVLGVEREHVGEAKGVETLVEGDHFVLDEVRGGA